MGEQVGLIRGKAGKVRRDFFVLGERCEWRVYFGQLDERVSEEGRQKFSAQV